MERVLVIIKPDGIEKRLVAEIINRINKSGLRIVEKVRRRLLIEECEMLYSHAKQKYPDIYDSLLKYMTRKPVVLMIVGGEKAIEKMQKIRGPSDPSLAPSGTIRGDFSKDKDMKKLYKEKRVVENVLHSSQNKEDAESEIRIFFDRAEKSNFFYSGSTKLYVSKSPLKIDARVIKAAKKIGLSLNWDDEGRINNIDFDDSKKLLGALKSEMLTPIEYWKVMKDAGLAKDKDMTNSLMSDQYTEWLDRVYLCGGMHIDKPKMISRYSYSGKKKQSVFPIGRPGWFNPSDNVSSQGVPKKVKRNRKKFSTSWKYWSPDLSVTKLNAVAPIRGYVTSVGKPSWDLGIPVDAKQPMLMIRECRRRPLDAQIPLPIVQEALRLIKEYDSKNNFRSKESMERIYEESDKYLEFISKKGELFRVSKELNAYKIREEFFNILGILKIISMTKKDGRVNKIDEVINAFSNIGASGYGLFENFVKNSNKRLKKSLKDKRNIVFVIGHKNPDTDTSICSLFESWRNSLIDKDTAYMPIIQSSKIPDEVMSLLGDYISKSIPLWDSKDYLKAKNSGLSRWISVDQNKELEIQKYFISIIDHHAVSDIASKQDIPKTLELIGSCTALVTQKMLGSGIKIDEKIAKILYGATLMDTENRVEHKMTAKDIWIMDFLKEKSKTESDKKFYRDLMSSLLNTNDPEVLFRRDYKEDWGFGFAVAKIKSGITKEGKLIKENLVKKALNLARKNNTSKNLPLTILKITDYKEDNETVNRERVYVVFNKASPEFKKVVLELMEKIIKFEFSGANIIKTKNYIEFWGTGMQLSRKKTAPILEPVVKVFNKFFYSPSIKLWVKRDFLKKSKEVIKTAGKLSIRLSADNFNRVNYLNYLEAKSLIKGLGYSILSLKEYWNVLNDAKSIKDIQMIESLQGSNFVEFLDTVIKEKSMLIEHPKVKGNKIIIGMTKGAFIPKGSPGLIHPKDIDLSTGLPIKVRKPNEYGNPDLWRYWSPDSDLVIPTRSYIFLLKQPCWDGKFNLEDSLPNLGVRPCIKRLRLPKVKIELKNKTLKINMLKEGDLKVYSWKKP